MKLQLSKIRIDGGTQQRAAIDQQHVDDLAEALANGEKLPPVRVFHDGKVYRLARGFHRYHAHTKAGKTEIECEVINGTLRDAILDSVGDNAEHLALKRSNADKRNAVKKLLDDEEWGKWSNREIAKQCRVNEGLVRKIKAEGGAYIRTPDNKNRLPDTKNNDEPVVGKSRNIFDEDEPVEPAEPTNGHPAKPPAPAVPLVDNLGFTIQREATAKIFERAREIREAMNQISALKCKIENAIKEGDELWFYVARSTFINDLENARRQLRFSVPHSICPYCGDDKLIRKTCDKCKGAGWYTIEIYDRNKVLIEEQRAENEAKAKGAK